MCQITRHVYVFPFKGALTRIHIFKLVSCAAFCADEGPRGAVFRSFFFFWNETSLEVGSTSTGLLVTVCKYYVGSKYGSIRRTCIFSLHGFCKHGSLTSISTYGYLSQKHIRCRCFFLVGHFVQLSGMVEKRSQLIMTTTRT